MTWQKKASELAGYRGGSRNAFGKHTNNTTAAAFHKPVSATRSRLKQTGTPVPFLPPDFKRADNFNAFAKTFGLNPADWRTKADFLNIEAAELREGYG